MELHLNQTADYKQHFICKFTTRVFLHLAVYMCSPHFLAVRFVHFSISVQKTGYILTTRSFFWADSRFVPSQWRSRYNVTWSLMAGRKPAIKISSKFVPKGQIDNIPALVQIMVWRRPDSKLLSEPMMVSLSMHICVTRPQWVHHVVIRMTATKFAIEFWLCVNIHCRNNHTPAKHYAMTKCCGHAASES